MSSSDWESLTGEELRQQDYDLCHAAAEGLREDLQGISPTHPLYSQLEDELALLDKYLAEHKKDNKK